MAKNQLRPFSSVINDIRRRTHVSMQTNVCAGTQCINKCYISMEQVKYAVREYACRAIDVLARRTRLAFTDVHAAREALPRIVDIMGEELGWNEQRKKVRSWKAVCILYGISTLTLNRLF